MTNETKDRNKINKEIAEKQKNMDKRTKEAARAVTDNETVANTAKELQRSGTTEGARDVTKGVTQAGHAVRKEHKKQSNEVKAKGIEPGKKSGREYAQRSEKTGKDAERLKNAASKINTSDAKSIVAGAERSAKADQKFLSDAEKRQIQDTKRGEKEIEKQKRKIQGRPITFPN